MINNIFIEKGLNLICGKANSGKTKYITNIANELSKNEKVLLISLECSKEYLNKNYGLNNNENIVVIDKVINVEEIYIYLDKYKPNYLLIDYLQLLNANNIKNALDILFEINNNYDIIMLVSDYISVNENVEKYNNSIYENCKQIFIIQDENVLKFK